MSRPRPRLIGFTLLAASVLLAGLTIWVATRPMRILSSERSEALLQMLQLSAAIEVFFYKDAGRYPSAEDFAKGVEYNYWTPQITIDPWGNPYQYRLLDSLGSSYELLSYGADGAPGGEGPNADIIAPPLR